MRSIDSDDAIVVQVDGIEYTLKVACTKLGIPYPRTWKRMQVMGMTFDEAISRSLNDFPERKCQLCGSTFKPIRSNQRFCGSYTGNSGCSNAQKRMKESIFKKTPKAKFRDYRHSAKVRGHGFELSFDEFMSLWGKPCSYCGEDIETIGIDRVDNSIGYVPSNIVPCCGTCNAMKMGHTREFFIGHIEKIISNRRR